MPTWSNTWDSSYSYYPTISTAGTDYYYYSCDGATISDTIEFKIKEILKHAIGDTLKELKMNISEEEFLKVLEDKIDA